MKKLCLFLSLIVSLSVMAQTAPISKGFLFEYVWESPAETKDDFIKLAKLVSRARNENSIYVKSRKGTYYIETASRNKTKIS